MRGRLGEDGDGQAAHPEGVQEDGRVVEVAEDPDAEGVDHRVGEEQRRVDAQGLPWCRDVGALDGRCRGDQPGESAGLMISHDNQLVVV